MDLKKFPANTQNHLRKLESLRKNALRAIHNAENERAADIAATAALCFLEAMRVVADEV